MATPLRTATTSGTSPSNPWLRLVHRLEETAALDRVVDPATARFRGLVGEEGTLRDLVDGRATHIPPHVILTDVPLGAWFMAQYLDLFDDEASRVAARRLVALGLAGAAPTALTGWLR